jgi:hypothetical protein
MTRKVSSFAHAFALSLWRLDGLAEAHKLLVGAPGCPDTLYITADSRIKGGISLYCGVVDWHMMKYLGRGWVIVVVLFCRSGTSPITLAM